MTKFAGRLSKRFFSLSFFVFLSYSAHSHSMDGSDQITNPIPNTQQMLMMMCKRCTHYVVGPRICSKRTESTKSSTILTLFDSHCLTLILNLLIHIFITMLYRFPKSHWLIQHFINWKTCLNRHLAWWFGHFKMSTVTLCIHILSLLLFFQCDCMFMCVVFFHSFAFYLILFTCYTFSWWARQKRRFNMFKVYVFHPLTN